MAIEILDEFAEWFQIAFQNSFSVEIRQNSLTHRHTLLWPLSFFVVLVRNSYPWWTNECTNSIFFLSPFPKLSPFPSPLTTLNFFLFFSWVWVHRFFSSGGNLYSYVAKSFPICSWLPLSALGFSSPIRACMASLSTSSQKAWSEDYIEKER